MFRPAEFSPWLTLLASAFLVHGDDYYATLFDLSNWLRNQSVEIVGTLTETPEVYAKSIKDRVDVELVSLVDSYGQGSIILDFLPETVSSALVRNRSE